MDLDQYIRFIVALLFVIALIMVVAWVMRRVGFGGLVSTPSRQRRLGVVEVLPLDGKRRLVLVRRDDQEHLLLLSAFGDTVVDGGARGGFRGALSDTAGPAQATETRP
ncbi:FliO/MopB family protein [Azospirillum canadense]|uniref:FliO/MopB family protein n=1 Tax=Azospirillum canadense TaxID=403962 RepID=UPI002226E784|nr:flagellar biosynthetic protein FliO [Azospirillum canadense]MCW2237388.1 flagellar protein FliO/FliZ [Azospirillum canadense]